MPLENHVLETLIKTYLEKGVSLSKITSDPLFDHLSLEQKVAAIRMYGDRLKEGTIRDNRDIKDLLSGILTKTIAIGSALIPLALILHGEARPGGAAHSMEEAVRAASASRISRGVVGTGIGYAFNSMARKEGEAIFNRYDANTNARNVFQDNTNFKDMNDAKITEILSRLHSIK